MESNYKALRMSDLGDYVKKEQVVGLLQAAQVQHGLSPSGNLINMHKIGKIASVGFNSHLLANT